MSNLPKEWEAIAAEYDRLSAMPRQAVERCYKLANKPPKELTDGEIQREWGADNSFDTRPLTPLGLIAIRRILAAHIRKQSEPERVKFRAAKDKHSCSVEMLMADWKLPQDWEWLDHDGKPQSFEVVLP